jgi:hypothetical protein
VIVGEITEVVAVVVEDFKEVEVVVLEDITVVVAVVVVGHYRVGSDRWCRQIEKL